MRDATQTTPKAARLILLTVAVVLAITFAGIRATTANFTKTRTTNIGAR